MDFSKFDITRLFDVSAALDTMEKSADSAMTYVPEQFKKSVVELNRAGFELARAQAAALTKFGETVQKQIKISA